MNLDILDDLKYILSTSDLVNLDHIYYWKEKQQLENFKTLGLSILLGFGFVLYEENYAIKLSFTSNLVVLTGDVKVSEYFLIQSGEDPSYCLEKAKERFINKLDIFFNV